MAKDIRIIQVCFNVLDPYQRELYEKVASQYNKSAYIKRLIENEGNIRSFVPVESGDFSPTDFI